MLGTSAAIPTRERNLSSVFLMYEDQRLLFDCGEGTQRQLMDEKLKFMKIDRIFISHWHADHFAGLLGLVQTMSMEDRKEPLYIYGPEESKKFVNQLLTIGYGHGNFEVVVSELKDGDIVDCGLFAMTAFETEHRIPSLGYSFEEKPKLKADMKKAAKFGLKTGPLIGNLKEGKLVIVNGKKVKPSDILVEVPGKKVVYTGDTRFSKNIIKYSKNADLLIADSTFCEDFIHHAKNYKHMTSSQAAKIAKEAGVKKLVLTHISRRYQEKDSPINVQKLLDEAKEVFPNSVLAHDFMEIEVM